MQYFRAVAVLSSVGIYFELPHTEAFMDYSFSRQYCSALNYYLSCSCLQLLGTVEWLHGVLFFVTVLYAFDNYSQMAHRVHRIACSFGRLCVLGERAMKFLADIFPYFSPLTYVSILRIFAFQPLRKHILFILSLNELVQGRKDEGNVHSVSSCPGEAKWFWSLQKNYPYT